MNPKPKGNLLYYVLKYAFQSSTWKALLPSLVLVSGYYALLYFIIDTFLNVDFLIPGFVVYSLGYVIAILFYFRLNNSYYRWMEGIKSMAYLRANAESFVIKAKAYLGLEHPDLKFLIVMKKNHYRALRDTVRGFNNPIGMIIPSEGYDKMESAYHLPSRINSILQDKVNDLYKKGAITKVQFLDLNRNIQKNTEHVSSAETLKGTPPPKTYIMHIRGFIIAYAAMIPFGFIHDLQIWMLMFLVVFFYFYAGLEIISDEVEDPFGFDENDIPVNELTELVEKRLDDITYAPS
jgi:ion channel-forming bestrophin family protein